MPENDNVILGTVLNTIYLRLHYLTGFICRTGMGLIISVLLGASCIAQTDTSSFGDFSERAALSEVCEATKLEQVESANKNFVSIGIALHPQSTDEGNRHYVPFLRLTKNDADLVVPLIPNTSTPAKFKLPCNEEFVRLIHIPENIYPSIEFADLSDAARESLLSEHEQIVKHFSENSHAENPPSLATYLNKLVIAELPVSWTDESLYPITADNKEITSLGDLVFGLIRQANQLKTTQLSIFEAFDSFSFLLYANSISKTEVQMPPLTFRVDNNKLCLLQNDECFVEQTKRTDAHILTQSVAPISIDLSQTQSEPEVTILYPIRLDNHDEAYEASFVKIFDNEEACKQDKANNFSEEGFEQTDSLQQLVRFSGLDTAALTGEKWIYLTDAISKLTRCSLGLIKDNEIHFELVKLRSDKPRRLIVWSPRKGFDQKFEGLRAAYITREILKSWIAKVYEQDDILPFTLVIIEPSGAAKLVLEGEELVNISAEDALNIVDSIDTAGLSDRALLDLSSVNSLIKSKFDRILYIVDSRNEAFRIEDVGVALSWKATKELTIVNLGQCENWYDILGESGFNCYSANELSDGITKTLRNFF